MGQQVNFRCKQRL